MKNHAPGLHNPRHARCGIFRGDYVNPLEPVTCGHCLKALAADGHVEVNLTHLLDLCYLGGYVVSLEVPPGREIVTWCHVTSRGYQYAGFGVSIRFDLGQPDHVDKLVAWSRSLRNDTSAPPPEL